MQPYRYVLGSFSAKYGGKRPKRLKSGRGLCYYPFMDGLDIVLTAADAYRANTRGKLCVVIDILRATTTITVALEAGCPAVIPAETPHEAKEIAEAEGCLLGGERESVRIDGFDFGNSPLEYTTEKIGGRPIAFTTTNGTRAIRACADCDALITASFLNRDAIVRYIEAWGGDVLLVCAGTRGEPTIEDTVCAGMLLDAIGVHKNNVSPAAGEAISLWNRHKGDLAVMMKQASPHGRSLVSLGCARDIDFAARLNTHDILPIREGRRIVRLVE
jgi:2-phosphosulfolactate phosphatase